VEPSTFELLLRCRRYWEWSGGALDITISPLLDLWGVGGSGRRPTEEEIAETLEMIGMDKVLFEEPSYLVYFTREGMEFDLGAVGKGTAVDDSLRLLREKWRVPRAYLSFGRSTIGVIGEWSVELLSPLDEKEPVGKITIRDEALSVSSVGPRRFVHRAYRDEEVDHIIDPRTGRARAAVLNVAVAAPSAEAADALSTALVILGEEEAPETAAAFGARRVVFIRVREERTTVRVLDVSAGTWTEESAGGEDDGLAPPETNG